MIKIIKFHLENDDFNEPIRIYIKHFDQRDVYNSDRLKVLDLFISWIDNFKEKDNITALSNLAAVFAGQPQYDHVYNRVCDAIQMIISKLN